MGDELVGLMTTLDKYTIFQEILENKTAGLDKMHAPASYLP